MNIIKVKINFEKGLCTTTGIDLIEGDYNSTKIEFEFDREEGKKVFELKTPKNELLFVSEIVNNEIVLVGEDNTSLFSSVGDYIYEVSLYEENSKLTSRFGYITIKKEQVKIGDNIVETYLPIFDQLMNEITTLESNIESAESERVSAEETRATNEEERQANESTRQENETSREEYIDELKQRVDSGEFKGEKGDKGDKGERGEKGDAGSIKFIIVDTLPEVGDETAIYLVPNDKQEQTNVYDEFIYTNGKWEQLGSAAIEVDLTDYVKNTDYASSTKGGVVKIKTFYGLSLSGQNAVKGEKITYQSYADVNTSNDLILCKGTLENVIAGKGLVSNTDYANYNTGGVVKSANGFITTSSGTASCGVETYSSYTTKSNNQFISKGTLENVITGKGLVSNVDYPTTTTGGVIKIGQFGTDVLNGVLRANIYDNNAYQFVSNNAFISKGTLENILNSRIGDIETALDTLIEESE